MHGQPKVDCWLYQREWVTKFLLMMDPITFTVERKNLDDSYLETQVPVVLEQIAKAINRLVFTLENTL